MATASRGIPAGLYTMQVAKVNSDGYAVGRASDPETLSTNTAYPAYRINHPVSYAEPNVTRSVYTARGGQSVIGQVDLGVEELGTFEITLALDDMEFDALISGHTVNTTTVIGATIGSPNRRQAVQTQVCLLIEVGFTDAETKTNLKKTVVIPRCTIARTGGGQSQEGGTNTNARTYTVTPSFTDTFITGQSYNGAVQTGLGLSLSEGETDQLDLVYSYGYMLHTYVGDNSEDEVTLPYKPVSSLVAITATENPNIIAVNGTRTLVTSISTTTGVVVFAAAPASGAICVFLIPTAWQATS